MDILSLITCFWLILHQVHGKKHIGDTSSLTVQKQIVDVHNRIRSEVSPSASDMLKMEWSNEAAKKAKAVAKKCVFGHSSLSERTIKDPHDIICGENLYRTSHEVDWKAPTGSWASERKYFKYGVGKTSETEMVGHFTQMIWADSYKVGCAVEFCKGPDSFYLHVCQYCPQGNKISKQKTPYTKGKPCSACKGSCEGKLCKNKPKKN